MQPHAKSHHFKAYFRPFNCCERQLSVGQLGWLVGKYTQHEEVHRTFSYRFHRDIIWGIVPCTRNSERERNIFRDENAKPEGYLTHREQLPSFPGNSKKLFIRYSSCWANRAGFPSETGPNKYLLSPHLEQRISTLLEKHLLMLQRNEKQAETTPPNKPVIAQAQAITCKHNLSLIHPVSRPSWSE